jgi:integrase
LPAILSDDAGRAFATDESPPFLSWLRGFGVLIESVRVSPQYLRVFRAVVTDALEKRGAEAAKAQKVRAARVEKIRRRKAQLVEAFVYQQTIDAETYKEQLDRIEDELAFASADAIDGDLEVADLEGTLAFAEHVITDPARAWAEFDVAPDGVYVIRYYAHGTERAPRVQETLGKMKHADAVTIYKSRLAAAAARRVTADDSRVTFALLAEEYVKVHCARKSVATRRRTEQALRKILPVFGARPVRTIRPLDIERYREAQLAAKVKPVTVNREWAIIKAILNKGEAWGMIERNPIRRGAVPMFEEGPGRLVFFEAEEWESFITAFDDDAAWNRHRTKIRQLGPVKVGLWGLRRYGGGMKPDSEATAAYRERLRATIPYFKTMLYTGSRPGEVLRILWRDVDLERGVVAVWQEKTSAPKTVPVSKAFREVLTGLRCGVGTVPLFVRPDGSPLTKDDVERAFDLAKRMRGIRSELTLYSIRHTFASWLAIQGTPIRTIQELLGHRDLRMTLRYAHLSPVHLRDAVEGIGAVEESNRRHLAATSGEKAEPGNEAKSFEENWWPQRDSNPCRGLERAVS